MNIITIDLNNINLEHICCAIGNDKKNLRRALSKKEWMKECFQDGLIFKRLDARGKVFIEYMPIEKAWKPVTGNNFMMINCLWVSGQYKGKGLSKRLLSECIQDTKQKKMDGIAVVTSSKVKPFLTDRMFYLKSGFKTVDKAPPDFELLVIKFTKDAKNPEFTKEVKLGTYCNNKDFSFIYSHQCPFIEEYVQIMSQVLQRKGISFESIPISNYQEAQRIGSPFGTLGIYYKGKFVTHILMTEPKFEELTNELTGSDKES